MRVQHDRGCTPNCSQTPYTGAGGTGAKITWCLETGAERTLHGAEITNTIGMRRGNNNSFGNHHRHHSNKTIVLHQSQQPSTRGRTDLQREAGESLDHARSTAGKLPRRLPVVCPAMIRKPISNPVSCLPGLRAKGSTDLHPGLCS